MIHCLLFIYNIYFSFFPIQLRRPPTVSLSLKFSLLLSLSKYSLSASSRATTCIRPKNKMFMLRDGIAPLILNFDSIISRHLRICKRTRECLYLVHRSPVSRNGLGEHEVGYLSCATPLTV